MNGPFDRINGFGWLSDYWFRPMIGGGGGPIITVAGAGTAPVLGALLHGETPADALAASATTLANYASSAGAIDSALAEASINGGAYSAANMSVTLTAGQTVAVHIVVTDDDVPENSRTFNAGAVLVDSTVPAAASAPTPTTVAASPHRTLAVALAADPDNGGSAITSRDLRHSSGGGAWTVEPGVTSGDTFDWLTDYYAPGDQVDWQERVWNANGPGAWSPSGSVNLAALTALVLDPTLEAFNGQYRDDNDDLLIETTPAATVATDELEGVLERFVGETRLTVTSDGPGTSATGRARRELRGTDEKDGLATATRFKVVATLRDFFDVNGIITGEQVVFCQKYDNKTGGGHDLAQGLFRRDDLTTFSLRGRYENDYESSSGTTSYTLKSGIALGDPVSLEIQVEPTRIRMWIDGDDPDADPAALDSDADLSPNLIQSTAPLIYQKLGPYIQIDRPGQGGVPIDADPVTAVVSLLTGTDSQSTVLPVPVLTSPIDSASGATAASGSITTDGPGTLYHVVTQSATKPHARQIMVGLDHTGTLADFSASQAVTGAGAQTLSPAPSGLVESTDYWIHYVFVAANGVRSLVVSGDGFTTAAAGGDTTAPVVNSATYDNGTYALSLDITEASGDVDIFVVPVTSPDTPDYSQIEAGTGGGALDGASFTTTDGVTISGTISFTNDVSLANQLHLFARDPSNNDSTPITVISGVAFAPNAMTINDWRLLVSNTAASTFRIDILSLPTTNGLTITDFEYTTDDGATWRSLGIATTGNVTINLLSDGVTTPVIGTDYPFKIRAVCVSGAAVASDEKRAQAHPAGVYAILRIDQAYLWSVSSGNNASLIRDQSVAQRNLGTVLGSAPQVGARTQNGKPTLDFTTAQAIYGNGFSAWGTGDTGYTLIATVIPDTPGSGNYMAMVCEDLKNANPTGGRLIATSTGNSSGAANLTMRHFNGAPSMTDGYTAGQAQSFVARKPAGSNYGSTVFTLNGAANAVTGANTNTLDFTNIACGISLNTTRTDAITTSGDWALCAWSIFNSDIGATDAAALHAGQRATWGT